MNNLFIQLILLLGGLIVTVIFFRYLFSSGKNKNSNKAFVAVDGTEFYNLDAFKEYEYLYGKFRSLYDEDALSKTRNKKEILGLSKMFLQKLKEEAFVDPKTLISYKDDFIKLSELFSYQEEMTNPSKK